MPSSDDPNNKQPSVPSPDPGYDEAVGMEELLEMYDKKMAEFSEGDIVRGRVVQVTSSEIIVDIGYKSEGLLSRDEMRQQPGQPEIKKGDEVEVYIERIEGPSGHVLLSREKAARMLVWDRIEEAFKNETPVTGRVLDRVKGGLAVDVGVKAFLPGSLIDTKPVKNLDALKGNEFTFKVISFDRKRNNVVLSRRAIVEVEQEGRKRQTFEELEEGKSTHGVVKNITDYGAFVDLGGVDGLLHITDISWGRVNHPSEFFNIADEIEVIVLKFDPVAERVSLGYKQKTPDPWLDVVDRYPLGSKVAGKVVSLTDYGAFIELEEGVEGLIHVSEMSWTRKVRNPAKLLNIGDAVEAVVSDVNVANRRISLSLKALEENPWNTIDQRYPVGATISGKVRNLTDFGAFVEVEDGIDGLIHISDMSWNRRLKHPSEVLKKGDVVTARVTSVDGENQRLSLSVKEFLPNEWDDYAKQQELGTEVVGSVSKITDFGLFVRLAEGVEGLAHVSEIDKDPRTKLDKIYSPDDVVRARIIKIDWNDKKIGLSLRDVEPPSEEEIAEYRAKAAETRDSAEPEEETAPPDDGKIPESEARETAPAEKEPESTEPVESAPQVKVESAPQVKVESAPEVEVESAPEVEVESTPEVEEDAASDIAEETTPETRS
ncbi:MAG TPA: 30S ribosomal protein S1 [Thermoanaerobaculia bacterium]|nr:30S ribosomal protein S1 [Thermoanaerobaculia bacterium]